MERPQIPKPPLIASGGRMNKDLLQTVSAIASVLGFLISLGTLVPFLAISPEKSAGLDVLRMLDFEGKIAVLLFSTPIFGLLNTVLVVSLAKIALALLQRCGVPIDSDAGALLLLFFILLPVATGANLAFAIVLFGQAFSAWPLVCVFANLTLTGYYAFRWLQNALY